MAVNWTGSGSNLLRRHSRKQTANTSSWTGRRDQHHQCLGDARASLLYTKVDIEAQIAARDPSEAKLLTTTVQSLVKGTRGDLQGWLLSKPDWAETGGKSSAVDANLVFKRP